MTSLYICYFGINEPLVQTQVLPYLRALRKRGLAIQLLTFDPRAAADATARWRERLASEGIGWTSLRYHKAPSLLATAFDILAGAIAIWRLNRRQPIDVLHARSHVAAAMALLTRRVLHSSFIFDIRGLMAEEYMDAGIWQSASLPFRAVKRVERASIRRADQVVVLTDRMRDWLFDSGLASRDRVEVIPCCVDLARFAPQGKAVTEREEPRPEVIYAGSTSGLYLFEEVGRLFLHLRAIRPGAFLRVLPTTRPEDATRILLGIGLARSDFAVSPTSPERVPAFLRRATLGISLRKPAFSQMAASPTKIPEYLAAGLPVICNAGIGDMDRILSSNRVGILVRDFTGDEYQRAAAEAWALASEPSTVERCRSLAKTDFDLETVGAERYLAVYRRLQ
jgi:glycosyltransferase involved in cell wall biosynthesis